MRATPDSKVTIAEFETWTREHASAQEARIEAAKLEIVELIESSGSGYVLESFRGLPTIRANMNIALLRSSKLNSDAVLYIDSIEVHDAELHGGYAGFSSMGSGGLSGGLCGGYCDGGGIDIGLWEGAEAPSEASGVARNNSRISTGNILTGYKHCPKVCTSDANCPDVNLLGQMLRRRCQPPAVGQTKVCVQDHLSWVAASLGMSGAYNYVTSLPSGAPNPPWGTDPNPNVPLGHSFSGRGVWDADIRVGSDKEQAGLDFLITTGSPTPDSCQQANAPPAVYVNRSQAGMPAVVNWAGRAFGTFVTASAGNSASDAVECSALRNGLCVGSFDYRIYHDQSNHFLSSFSSYLNGTGSNNSLERPHLLGPGNHWGPDRGLHMPSIDLAPPNSAMRHASYDGGVPAKSVSGTSFSAPAVLAVAVQAHQYEGWFSNLAFPMVNKAVILASTRDANNHGAIGLTNAWSQNAPTNDAKDGAGQIGIPSLKAILDGNQYAYISLSDSDFTSCGTGCRKHVVGSVSIPAYSTLRLAMAWQSCMIAEGDTPVLNNDLDLILNCGSPIVVCGGTLSSNSVVSEIEMIHRAGCLYPKSCTIEIRLKNGAPLASCGSTTTERVGVAWSFNNQ